MITESIIFGAGNIGRGFIGQLFSESGLPVTFVDVDQPLIDALNARGSYTVRLVDNAGAVDVAVGPVQALPAGDVAAVAAAVARAEIAATAVGVRALPHIAPLVAAGVAGRARQGITAPLNIILCENLKDAAAAFHAMVAEHLPLDMHGFLHAHVGFVDTVIGRMVPPLTPEMRAADPSLIVVEPYKELPVDRRGLVGPVPEIVGLEACDYFPAYTARKLYIHNCGHAVLAYLGYIQGHEYGYQALEDPLVRRVFDAAMAESRAGIVAAHAARHFPLLPPQQAAAAEAAWLDEHIVDLTRRFANRALGDTVLRLGRDPARKLSPTDRLIGATRLVEQAGITPEALAWAIAAGYSFDDERDPLALALQQRIAGEGLDAVMADVSEIDPGEPLATLVRERYHALRRGELP
jgi:mannitol-1-phosphate 5-dehydrogenase